MNTKPTKEEDLIILDKEVNTIDDIINLGKTFDPKDKKKIYS